MALTLWTINILWIGFITALVYYLQWWALPIIVITSTTIALLLARAVIRA